MTQLDRYARQMILPEIGSKGQDRLDAAHILIVGAGGLGVPVLQYLVGAGVGQITLLDQDLVEEHNLHRQPIYGAHIGQSKVMAAAQFCRTLNASVKINPIQNWLTPANAPDFIAQSDLVLDCADSFAASYTLSDLCLTLNKPLLSSSVTAMAGYVGGFCGGAPSLRAVFPDVPLNPGTCDSVGVVGPVVGMFGALQAQMALSVLLGLTPSPLGQIFRFDMLGMRSSTFRFDGAQEPKSAPHRFIARADVTSDDFVVELRGTAETPQLLVPQAQRFSVSNIGPDGPMPANGQRAIFVCRSGLRAWNAADRLRPYWGGEIALLADF
jgi:molybdopterin/thiamine biosynthesis adenylyltransferase